MEHNKEFYDELKDAGYLFQLNLMSFAGVYGRAVQQLANHIAAKGYYDLVGTHLHNQKHLKALHDSSLIAHEYTSFKRENPRYSNLTPQFFCHVYHVSAFFSYHIQST